MKRKIVKQGEATLMVSLPLKWAREHGLNKGNELEVSENGSNLIFSVESSKDKLEGKINLIGTNETLIRTLIVNAYREGYDRIKVEYENDKQLNILQEIITSKLIGFEIIKKDTGFCIVENVTEPSVEQFDNILNKIFMNITELFDVTAGRANKKSEKIENFEDIESRIQRYDSFCRRVVEKKGLKFNKSQFLLSFLSTLNHAQRELYFANKVLEDKVFVSPKVRELIEKSKQLFLLVVKSYSDKDISLVSEIHNREKEFIYEEGYKLLAKTDGKETIFLCHLLFSIRQFYLASSPLVGLFI